MTVSRGDGRYTYTDETTKERFIFSKEIFFNVLSKDCVEIATSFDKQYSDVLDQLAQSVARIHGLVFIGLRLAGEKDDALLENCALLINNAEKTIVAALQCLRNGFVFQCQMLLRNVIEICAVVIHLCVKPELLESILLDQHDSTNSIKVAKKQIPIIGKIWGLLSKHVHVTPFHLGNYPLMKYSPKDEVPILVTIGTLGSAVFILDICTERVVHNQTQEHLYWRTFGGEIQLNISNFEHYEWIEKYLSPQSPIR